MAHAKTITVDGTARNELADLLQAIDASLRHAQRFGERPTLNVSIQGARANDTVTVARLDLTPTLRDLVKALVSAQAVVWNAADEEVSPALAAEVLGVSPRYVDRLLECGNLAARRVGTELRIPVGALLERLAESQRSSAEARRALTKTSEDYGLYD